MGWQDNGQVALDLHRTAEYKIKAMQRWSFSRFLKLEAMKRLTLHRFVAVNTIYIQEEIAIKHWMTFQNICDKQDDEVFTFASEIYDLFQNYQSKSLLRRFYVLISCLLKR